MKSDCNSIFSGKECPLPRGKTIVEQLAEYNTSLLFAAIERRGIKVTDWEPVPGPPDDTRQEG